MKKSAGQDFFMSTTARLIIKKWGSFHELICSSSVVTLLDDFDFTERLAPQNLVQNAFFGLYSPIFRALLSPLMRLEPSIILLNLDVGLTGDALDALKKQYGLGENDISGLSLPKCEKLQKKVLTEIGKLKDPLSLYHQESCQLVLTHLEENSIILSENERSEFFLSESWEGLNKRLDDFSIASLEPGKPLSLSSYFRHKLSIFIRNALSRNHKSHGDSDVSQILKRLKKMFSILDKKESEFLREFVKPLMDDVESAMKTPAMVD